MSRPRTWAVFLAITLTLTAAGQATDVGGKASDPFSSRPAVRVLLFVRTDCPLTDRYAPEIHRIAAEFATRGVRFWLVYPDPAETPSGIQRHIAEYRLPGTPVPDPRHTLVRRAEVTVAPEAAVFDITGQLIYAGRIDDRYVEFGKTRPARTHDLESAISAALSGKPVVPSRTRAIGCFLADIR